MRIQPLTTRGLLMVSNTKPKLSFHFLGNNSSFFQGPAFFWMRPQSTPRSHKIHWSFLWIIAFMDNSHSKIIESNILRKLLFAIIFFSPFTLSRRPSNAIFLYNIHSMSRPKDISIEVSGIPFFSSSHGPNCRCAPLIWGTTTDTAGTTCSSPTLWWWPLSPSSCSSSSTASHSGSSGE